MDGPTHYLKAEECLAQTIGENVDTRTVEAFAALAQVHATLALVAITAEGIFDPAGRPLLGKSAATEGWERVL